MPVTDKRVDAYIEKSNDFAKPILHHLRKLIHTTVPDVTETIKWGMPSFEYKGPYCSMAAFKQHCAFGFWKASLMKDANKMEKNPFKAMGNLGRIESMKDLPTDKKFAAWLKEAKKLNDDNVKLVRTVKPAEEVETPPAFLAALKKNKTALKNFENFPPGCRKEYNQWIAEAKTEPTRDKRIAEAMAWIAEGKRRNWKYQKC